jgi:hypothetical protein
MDPGDLPSRSVSIMAFELCRDDATRESFFAFISVLFDNFNTVNLWVIQLLTSYEFPPDGSYGHKMFSFAFFGNFEISSGARLVLPMRVAPEDIVEKYFFGYRLK